MLPCAARFPRPCRKPSFSKAVFTAAQVHPEGIVRQVEALEKHPVRDNRNRPLRDLRISVTDRCNFRCDYCMPKEVFGSRHLFAQRSKLLTFEEIERLVSIVSPLGVEKIRLTGGEPLIRRDLEHLIAAIAAVPGIQDLSLTTNGSLLSRKKARALKAAGLQRITISLDALDDRVFRKLNDVNFPVERVLEAIDTAVECGLDPVKVNMVVRRGANEDQILPMVRYFRNCGVILRFIEFMDVGNSNNWNLGQVFSLQEIADVIESEHALQPLPENYSGEVAKRWRYRDGSGEIGIISSVTEPFCGSCSRLRLSAEGKLYTCLFAASGNDLREPLRSGASDAEIRTRIETIWGRRSDRYSEQRSEQTVALPKIEMSYIGG